MASASATVLKTEARLMTREPGVLFWIIAFPTLLMVILGLIPGFDDVDPDLGGRRIIDLYVPVAALLAVIMAGLQAMPPILIGYRERGILRRMSTTPVRPATLLTSQIILLGGGAFASAALVIAVGGIAFGVELPGNIVGYLLALILATAGALAMGGLVCAIAPTQRAGQAIGSALFFPSMFTAGVWLPVQTMPDLLRDIVSYSPMGASSEALDAAMRGGWPHWIDLAVMALWAALLTAGAARWFRWE
ncbi:ABC transporter permease [Streptomyces sp. NPDC051217]|uniref:ABC transporter permease n=1 Tax=Streptomyces sp. NPDC051217 TaxID=3365644 RepID=UPI0037A28B34